MNIEKEEELIEDLEIIISDMDIIIETGLILIIIMEEIINLSKDSHLEGGDEVLEEDSGKEEDINLFIISCF